MKRTVALILAFIIAMTASCLKKDSISYTLEGLDSMECLRTTYGKAALEEFKIEAGVIMSHYGRRNVVERELTSRLDNLVNLYNDNYIGGSLVLWRTECASIPVPVRIYEMNINPAYHEF